MSNGWKDFLKIENDLVVIEISETSDIRIDQESDIKVFSVKGNLVDEAGCCKTPIRPFVADAPLARPYMFSMGYDRLH